MKFECDSCHAQYMIADEKVGKRGVKVKCKRCGHVIIVRPGADASAARAEGAKAQADAPGVDHGDGNGNEGADDGAGTDGGGSSDVAAPAAAARPAPAPVPEPAPELTGPGMQTPAHDDATTVGGIVPPEVADRTEIAASASHAAPAAVPAPVAVAPVSTPSTKSAPAAAPKAPPAAPVAGESSIGDALDEQLAGAFSTMFDGASPGNAADLAALAKSARPPEDDDDDRGPTRVLDAGAIDALRKAAAQESVVDKSALDSLRRDLAGREEEPSGMWNERPRTSSAAATQGSSASSSLFGAASAASSSRDGARGASGADDDEGAGEWHVAIDDEDVGPITLAELGRHIESGRVDRSSLVWKTGMDDWLPAGEVKAVRPLFDNVPLPRIAREDPAPKSSSPAPSKSLFGAFDMPSLEDVPPPVGSPFDNVPPLGGEESDPSWRPHGLTDVYQAANLAEAAVGSGGALAALATGGPSLSNKPSPSTSSEPEWKPGASSALASLVNDEIDRLSKAPLPAADDDLGVPPANDDSIVGGAALPFAGLGASSSAALDGSLGPPIGGPLGAPSPDPVRTPARTTSGIAPAVNFDAPAPYQPAPAYAAAPSFSPPGYAPSAPAPSKVSPLVIAATVGGGLFLLAILALLGVIALRLTSPQQPVAVAAAPAVVPGLAEQGTGAAGSPTKAAGTAAAVAPAPTPSPPPAAPDAATAPSVAPPAPAGAPVVADAATPPSSASAAAATAGAASTAPSPPPAVDDGKKLAMAEKKRTESRNDAATRAPSPPPEERKPILEDKKPSLPSAACDPVLDLGCDSKKASSSKAPPAGPVKDKLEKSDILVVVKGGLPKVAECGRKNKASGTIKMSWKVGKDGKPTDVTVADPKYAGTPTGACVVGVVKAFRFPAYSGAQPPPISIPLPLQ